ncbi:TPA: hypothetical protein EYP45_03400 [Candidatus Peregrinibacteria bacterium]|nr:hypothetical protein [Candidatus Peregrinibacteria bacterium]
MNSKQIREVLTKIQNEVTCPKCNKKINPKDLKITSHNKETCTLEITCTPCKFTFGGQAMFKEYLTSVGKKMNASSRANHKKIQNKTIQNNDKIAISEKLKSITNISDVL